MGQPPDVGVVAAPKVLTVELTPEQRIEVRRLVCQWKAHLSPVAGRFPNIGPWSA
jgi:hypothetical protein